jgi:hypothetical protein
MLKIKVGILENVLDVIDANMIVKLNVKAKTIMEATIEVMNPTVKILIKLLWHNDIRRTGICKTKIPDTPINNNDNDR